MSKRFLTDVIARAADMPASAAGRLAGEVVAAIRAEIVRTGRFSLGSVRVRASWPIWSTGAARVGSGLGGVGVGDGLCGLRLGRRHRAAGAHGPGLPPVPLPGVRQAVQRALSG